MTLAELIAEVYTITNRPDLVAETSSAIRKATLKMHSLDYFYKDLQETIIGFAVAGYKQQYDLQANLPDYRTVKYLRHWSATATGEAKYLRAIDPAAVVNQFGKEGTDIWYIAGNMLNIKAAVEVSNLVIGYYRRPNITTNLFSSWIAVEEPFYIIEEAAATLFKTIGHSEMANTYRAMSGDNAILLRQNYLEPQAR